MDITILSAATISGGIKVQTGRLHSLMASRPARNPLRMLQEEKVSAVPAMFKINCSGMAFSISITDFLPVQ